MIILEVLSIALVFLAGCSGLLNLVVWRKTFAEFGVKDIIAVYFVKGAATKRLPVLAGTYIGTAFTAALALYDAYLRLAWAINVGWEATGNVWALHWLSFHALLSIVFIIYHIFVWQLCRAYGSQDED